MRLALIILTFPVFAAEEGYIDPSRCRACHEQIYDSYAKTEMGQSFQKAGRIPALAEFVHKASGRRYSVVQRGDKAFLRRSLIGGEGVIEKQIDFVVGSGNHSKTFLHRDPKGRLLELPVSWYSDKGGYWAMGPGYDRPDHSDFRREVSDSCLFCHNGYPSQANGGVATGIDCQRCHGPGAAHVSQKKPMLNPAKLTRDRQMEICMQCHMESASRTLPDAVRAFDRSTFSYRPGEPLADYKLYFNFAGRQSQDSGRITVNNSAYGLRESRCFQRSGAMTCTACHDPHQPLRSEEARQRYTTVCRSCHSSAHDAKTSRCTDCHMQKRRTEDAVHVVMTDHRIRRWPLTGNLLEPIAEQHDRLTGPVTLLYPDRLPNSAEARLRLAVARVQASSDVAQEIPKLRQAINDANPKSPEPYIVLANACRTAGQADNAIAAYRQAVAKGSTQIAPFIALGELLLERSRGEEAITVIESATRKLAPSAALWNSLSVLYARVRKPEEARRAVSKALEIDPDDPIAWLNLGVCLQATKDRKGAEAAYRHALLLQPDLKRAQDYLRLLSEDKL